MLAKNTGLLDNCTKYSDYWLLETYNYLSTDCVATRGTSLKTWWQVSLDGKPSESLCAETNEEGELNGQGLVRVGKQKPKLER